MQNAMTRSFQLDRENCLLHIPDQPNGYLILYLGDAGHYVEEDRSFWGEHRGRATLLQALLDKGYTLYTSRIYGNHWGSEPAVNLLNRVYQYVIRQEILNPYIHVIAEGMGALAALRWHEQYEVPIRSFVLLTPCVDMKGLYAQERTNQLYFKRLTREISNAYKCKEDDLDQVITGRLPKAESPILLFHDMANPHYTVHEHSRRLEEKQQAHQHHIELKLVIQPIFPRINSKVIQFMNSYEKSVSEPI
ncbi:hydrolase [Pontibacillus chungwhensis BH030062]|uniref:Hydrolase n=1 Tax=Pontibacillus chungwhensis BH030062 TaxID=1385513 RepID=A0A0A2UQZ7_9BACI|nr:alpha/beta hydrolase [Pontibacillus chungwhensis]KGP90732.1 hydrolase [Pontibacillus chungwhensis BH030062]